MSEGHLDGVSIICRIAELAPSLKEAELRVLLELTRRWGLGAGAVVSVSSRELARSSGCGRRWLQAALDSLASRGLLSVRAGSATAAAAYTLQFVRTVRMGGGVVTPQWRLFDATPGDIATPPPTENTALNPTSAAVSISTASLQLIDRVLSAKSTNLDRDCLATFRNWLHGYMQKLGRDEANRPLANPHPPSDDLVAQFLAIAEPRRLGTLLDSLLLDQQTCHSYGWFVTVALQRIHGLHFREIREARAALRVVRKGGRQVDPEWQQQTLDTIGEIAKAKKL